MNYPNRLDDVRYVRHQYKSKDNLAVRIRTHELYTESPVDFTGWILDRIQWQGNEHVVDVGCGAGSYVEAVRQRTRHYVAADFSFGMLQELKFESLPRINLDAQWLPLPANCVDVLLANHMLYHVPDRDRAIGEFARVLRPGGYLLAATNGEKHMSELTTLQYGVAGSLGLELPEQLQERSSPFFTLTGANSFDTLQFTLENGAEILSRHFTHVERHLLPGALVFPDAQPVIDYLASTRERIEQKLPEGTTWDTVVTSLRTILQDHIARYGSFRVNKLAGVFVCSNN